MKTILIIICLMLTVVGCSQQKVSKNTTQKNDLQMVSEMEKNKNTNEGFVNESKKTKIQLEGIDNHSNKKQMEWFLNNYKEEFIASDIDWKTLENSNLMKKGYKFHTALSKISLILIFCKHQDDALIIANTNFPEGSKEIFGVNGGALFVVQGDDPNEVTSVLSWFAGDE